MSDLAPRRTHPGTILLEALHAAPSTLLAIPALFAMGAELGLAKVLFLLVGGTAAILVYKWIGWRSFTYRLTERELIIERGIVQRQRRSIPLDRVQDVAIEQKALARLAGLAIVRVETGGGEADEAVLDSVTLAEAHRLREVLRAPHAPGAATAAADLPPPILFAMPVRQVLLFGVFNFSLFWVAAGFGGLQSLDQVAQLDWRWWLGAAGRELRHVTPLILLSLLAAALVLGAGAGILRTVLRDYGFRVEDLGNRFRRTRGLLTRSEVVIAKPRIQLAMVHRAPVRRLFGWQALAVQTLGGSDDAGGREVLVPFGQGDGCGAGDGRRRDAAVRARCAGTGGAWARRPHDDPAMRPRSCWCLARRDFSSRRFGWGCCCSCQPSPSRGSSGATIAMLCAPKASRLRAGC